MANLQSPPSTDTITKEKIMQDMEHKQEQIQALYRDRDSRHDYIQ